MAHMIVKLGEAYFGWSTIFDAPLTYAMTRDQMLLYARQDGRSMAGRVKRGVSANAAESECRPAGPKRRHSGAGAL